MVLKVRRPNADELDEVEQLTLEHTTQVATACALLAWHLRMEARTPGAWAALHAKLAALRRQVEVPDATVADCIVYYLHVAPAMFAFCLLLWELVLTVELDPAVQDV